MKRAIAIALLIIGIASILLFPSIWFFIGMTISVLGFIILIRKPKNKTSKNIKSEIDKLKAEGHKIFVDFNDCKILTNNYNKEVPRSSDYRAQAFDTIFDKENAVENIASFSPELLIKTLLTATHTIVQYYQKKELQ